MNTPHYITKKRRIFMFAVVSLLLAASLACGLVAGAPTPINLASSNALTFMPTLPNATFTLQPKATNTIETNIWTGIGPWVNINILTIDPVTPAIIYAGTDGGIFKSMNGGQNWSAVNSGLSDSEILDLVIDPVTPTIIYAVTGVDTEKGGGVFKSTNSAENWNAVNNGLPNNHVSNLSIDPLTPSTLYVVTFFDGVFKSTNGGKSWKPINTGLSDSNPAMALEVDPIMSSILYLVTYVGGILKSTNGGESWNAINNGLDLDTANENSIDELVIDPVTSTTLYVLTRNKGIFKSTNGGQNWIAFDTGLPLTDIGNSILLINPLTPTTLYIGTFSGKIFKSIDNGRNWRTYSTGLNNNYVTVLVADPLHPAILYVGTYGGGAFTNQFNRAFIPAQMPSLTAAPTALAESPLSTIPAPTKDISSLSTLRPAEFPFTVSGTLNNRKQIQLPKNARIVVVWVVTAGNPDYDYVFGEGTIDYGNNSFEVKFDEPPPSEALNWCDSGVVGVGIMLITTDERLKNGIFSPDSIINTDVLGASGQYSIIYIEGNFKTLEMGSWLRDFNEGYSVGKGIKVPSSFDGFEPIDPTTIEIIIDDLENIEFVNWT